VYCFHRVVTPIDHTYAVQLPVAVEQ
jgi:hypothetical protein